MLRTALLACLACVAFAPSAVFAQAGRPPNEPDPDPGIVVTGELPTRDEVTSQAREVTQSTALRYAPLPRFEGDRLCPGVIGLKADFAGLVVDRLRANAERFGLWMTKDDGTCQANFIVAFVDDGQAVLHQVHDRWYWLFSDMPRHDRIELLAEEGPAHVWITTRTRTADGMPLGTDLYGRQVRATSSGGVARHSIPVREDIVGVLVLFDRDDVRDMTLVQLADYATMRGLARTRPVDDDGQAMSTILALFDTDATPPVELTAFDSAYLASLYAGRPNTLGINRILGVDARLRRAQAEQAAADDAGE